jgi:hypothetical protein
MKITKRDQGELDITEATLIMSKKVKYKVYTSMKSYIYKYKRKPTKYIYHIA